MNNSKSEDAQKRLVIKIFFGWVICSVTFFTSCGTNQVPEDTKIVAENKNESKFDNTRKELDAQFLVNMVEMDIEQIRLGQLAQITSKLPDIIKIGKMMEESHLKSLQAMTTLAKSKNISIPAAPTDDAKEEVVNLENKKVEDFDKSYCNKLIYKHREAIATCDNISTESHDKEIQSLAKQKLLLLRAHLEIILKSQKKWNNT